MGGCGRRGSWLVAALGVGLTTAGCAHGGMPGAAAATVARPAGSTAPPTAFRFTPTAGKVKPSGHLAIAAAGASLTKVVARTGDGHVVAGGVSGDRRTWRSTGYLPVNARITVTVTARRSDGAPMVRRHAYTTVAARDTEKVALTPTTGRTVGVAMPIVADFDNPVTDKAAVERRLVVHSVPAVEGSWHWMSDHQVIYRPASYWPAGTHVTVSGDLRGVELTRGVWGADHSPVSFTVGADNENTVDIAHHVLVVRTAGRVVRTIPVTTGKPGATTSTRVGVKVIMSQEQTTRMVSTSTGVPKDSPDYYDLQVHWAQRLTYSGEYLHAAPWSVWAQGRQNVSHGCTGMSTANANWLMAHSRVGDPVKFVNGSRPLEEGNGWTMWNRSYAAWKAGSALR